MKNIIILVVGLLAFTACGDTPNESASPSNTDGSRSDANGKADTTTDDNEPNMGPSEPIAGGAASTDLPSSDDPESTDIIANDPNEIGDDPSMTDDTATTPVVPTDDTETNEDVDVWADARDVNKHKVEFGEDVVAESYQYPQVSTGFGLGGTEFWQKWAEGHNPTYSFYEGTAHGRRCMQASAIRFESIMAEPPEELVTLKEESNWSGRFFNWNDDYSQSEWGDGRSARLWAWRTGLVKWISQTNKDGSCYLPTLDLVKSLAANCAAYAERSDGEIQGCTAR